MSRDHTAHDLELPEPAELPHPVTIFHEILPQKWTPFFQGTHSVLS